MKRPGWVIASLPVSDGITLKVEINVNVESEESAKALAEAIRGAVRATPGVEERA